MTNLELKRLYDECNMLYFNNELNSNIEVVWSNRMTRTAGTYKRKMDRKLHAVLFEKITLSEPYHKKYPEEIRATLVHEMIHAKYPKDCHGSSFKAEMERLNREFNLGITVYSSGPAVINYHYICKECGTIFERTNAISNYHLYKCNCGGKLIEKRVSEK